MPEGQNAMLMAARFLLNAAFKFEPEDIHSTSWLNGLRGLAAFLVAMSHWTEAWLSPFAAAPFGAIVLGDRNPDDVWYFLKGDRLWAPWRLPIVHLLMDSGSAQVAVFFVISGFVLTWGPLASVQSGQYERLLKSVGSSATRRWSRLFLPCIIVTTVYVVRDAVIYFRGIGAGFSRIGAYFIMAAGFVNPFLPVDPNFVPPIQVYNLVLWTIPVEFQGSLFVYMLLVAFGRLKDFKTRMLATATITFCAFLSSAWSLWLFGAGMLLADYVRYSGGFDKLSDSTRIPAAGWTLVFAVGLLCMGFMPDTGWTSRPGYEWTAFVPLPPGWRTTHGVGEERFWFGCGGILIVASSCHLAFMRRFFELPFLQHLGKVSFMLYLSHIFINQTVATPLRALVLFVCPTIDDHDFNQEIYQTGPLISIFLYIFLLVFCVPTALFVAQLLEKHVDQPVTAFGKWVDRKLQEGVISEQPATAEVREVEQRQPMLQS